ncbi:MAG: hypothetical protein FJ290_05720 [Planctomycetes bacterium]|nr:hypothetical protein [Planctomycetota bacterium]
MNSRTPRRSARALSTVGTLVAAGVLSLLLALGYSGYRGARTLVHIAQAESNLKQIGTAMELFYSKYSSYPPQGADLVAVLAPYVRNLSAFRNPLADEATPGQVLSQLYREPSLSELDSVGHYVTAFVSSDCSIAVVLRRGGRVESYTALSLPSDPGGMIAMLSSPAASHVGPGAPPQPASQPEPQPEPPAEPVSGGTLGGDVNLNSSNSDDFEFELLRPDGTRITRDDLLASNGSLVYTGPAVLIRLKPKGNGNQNTLTLNGQVYQLDNSKRYIFLTLSGGSMVVHLYNAKAGKGKAMGQWWIALNAVGAKIVVCNCHGECTCVEANL